MISMLGSQIAAIVNGSLIGPDEMVTGDPQIDSRHISPGQFFIALPGQHVDGHEFVESAKSAGAVAAIVTRAVDVEGISQIVVADAGEALKALAIRVRSIIDPIVIGITGSQGKTTAKDMLGQVLAEFGETISPIGNFNNELGLPLTLLRCTQKTQYLVLELGARHVGEIAELARIARLDFAVVLGVGTAHVGEFGGVEAIALAKSEIFSALESGGVTVLGTYDEHTCRMAEMVSGPVVTFGPEGEIRAEGIELHQGCASFLLPPYPERIHLKFLGSHQVANAEAVLAIAEALRLDRKKVGEALSLAKPLSPWRMEKSLLANGGILINDAYNANPVSMLAAIVTTVELAHERGGEALALLGEMRELGASSEAEHATLGRLVAESGITVLFGVGESGETMVKSAQSRGIAFAEHIRENVGYEAEIAGRILARVKPSDVILVKASRGVHFERIARLIAQGGVA